ncbi:TetR/AcrR family transcriptional regulator [Nocardia camponoti]|uniref:TetR family transcriptional regulator n=1 Tax=Nocardia camponoti TaxID=1616106 RepID=A0A917V8E0_9NOCA|nr:TetR/AcrR family transcriptional regulator [Nocardia camponoti]GGK51132.1 TetR family transcriptional regulator [Nocardia camponoti]
MGTREDLLNAAKRCLADRGYARTTVRDIVAVSGTNLAAINYHFGTRDKLLQQAMLESSAAAVEQILDALPAPDPAHPAARLEAFWTKLIASFTADPALWHANAEALNEALHTPELRRELAAAQSAARAGLAETFGNGNQSVGALLQTMIGGLLLQWLIDPENAPTPIQLTAGVRAL